jgi:RNA polymerase sigma-70 factor (ECF subfamily)
MPAGGSMPTDAFGALRRALLPVLLQPLLATTDSTSGGPGGGRSAPSTASGSASPPDHNADAVRVSALVDLARRGDVDAFGALYDHYVETVFRFVYYRVNSTALAEDLVGDTFFRALRSISSFQWQGKDFGAWLITIARNLIADHYKSGRTRLETTTDDFSGQDGVIEGPESEVLAGLTSDILKSALAELPGEQHDCLVLRFLVGQSIAETAKALGRSEGAVKQLQLRAIRNLAKRLPEDLR